MVPCHDPLESFWNSVHALESGLHHAARDLEHHWQHHQRLQHPHQSWAGDGKAVRFLHPSSAKKRRKDVVADAEEGPSSAGMGWFPMKSFMGSGGSRCRELPVRRKAAPALRRGDGKEDDSCSGCMNFLTAWSLLLSGISQAFPNPFKSVRKCFQKQFDENDAFLKPLETKPRLKEPSRKSNVEFRDEKTATSMEKKHEVLPLDLLLCYVIDTVVHSLHLFDQSSRDEEERSSNHRAPSPSTSQFDHMKVISGIIKGKKADVDSFLLSMRFARVGGAPPSLVDLTSSVKDETQDHPADANNNREEPETNSVQKISSGLLNIPLSNVERLRSTLSTVSLTELIEHIPQLVRAPKDHPDKKKLISVQDFFRYTEVEGRRFFEELDRDGDGQVTLEDLELAMRKRKLPRKYAKDFFRRTRSHLFSKSFGWKQFLSLIKLKDPTILRAYTTLCLSKSGTLQKNQIVTSLRSAGLPANEDNAAAMMRYLVADSGGSISYSHFRNFMLLLPSERLEEDPRSIWFEAATVVAVPPPVEIPAENVLKSALAGGLACALSTSLMHPVDTMKTRVQASTLSFPELVAKLPQIGIQGLYRGSIPAIIGQFSSHGLRTGIFEATKLVLVNVAPTLPDIQVQSLASFCSTILGTAVRIPCEVLKQRLQAGIFDNVGEAIVGTIRQDGFKGFFRGTGATLCREVPFYVAGMGLYAEAKKATQNLLDRDLEPWETIVVGALSGGLAAVVTTPFDVMKTRMMTAPQGLPVSMSMVAFSILRQEGPLGLFKGAVPRFFWIAPLGAMNFAGYELAKKAMMDKPEQQGLSGELLQEKKMSNSG